VKVFITGAAGFVGAALTRRLLTDGHEVHAIVKSTSAMWRLEAVKAHLRLHHVDLRDEAVLTELLKTIKPEVIYHLAAHGAYSHQSDADQIIQTNLLGSWNLLKATAAIDYLTFVNTGSSSEYGFKDSAMRETDYLEPNSYYSVTKGAQTLLCQLFSRAEQRSINTFRLFSAYGPLEEPSRLIPTVIRSSLAGEPLRLVPPEVARDFVYIDDVIEAFINVAKLGELRGEIINVGSGVQSTVRDVVDNVFAATGKPVECQWGAMQPRIWDSKIWVADATKSYRLLGWRARTTLEAGLRKTVEQTA
jgi:nucleoside-diphosphate-sugar epimerase